MRGAGVDPGRAVVDQGRAGVDPAPTGVDPARTVVDPVRTVVDPARTVVAEAEERPIVTDRGAARRVRRSAPRDDRVVVLRSTAVELALLVEELRSIAESTTCLDVRAAVARRTGELQEEQPGWVALPLPEARRVRVRLRLERETVRREGVGCRHVVDASRRGYHPRRDG
jgi:hypothetical protein